MENLWMHYSDGKFGFTVQKRIWRQQGDNFEKFCTKIMQQAAPMQNAELCEIRLQKRRASPEHPPHLPL